MLEPYFDSLVLQRRGRRRDRGDPLPRGRVRAAARRAPPGARAEGRRLRRRARGHAADRARRHRDAARGDRLLPAAARAELPRRARAAVPGRAAAPPRAARPRRPRGRVRPPDRHRRARARADRDRAARAHARPRGDVQAPDQRASRSSRARSGGSSASRSARARRADGAALRACTGARSIPPGVAVGVRLDYPHRTGEHCASTALRNLLAHHGTELSEAMVFGLASGLGFFYFKSDAVSPTRMFHGRTPTFEQNLAREHGHRAHADRGDRRRSRRAAPARATRRGRARAARHRHLLPRLPPHHEPLPRTHLRGGRLRRRARRGLDRRPQVSRAPDLLVRGAAPRAQRARLPDPLREPLGRLRRRRAARASARAGGARRRCGAARARCSRPTYGRAAAAAVAAMRALAADFPSWSAQPDWSWAARFASSRRVRSTATST